MVEKAKNENVETKKQNSKKSKKGMIILFFVLVVLAMFGYFAVENYYSVIFKDIESEIMESKPASADVVVDVSDDSLEKEVSKLNGGINLLSTELERNYAIMAQLVERIEKLEDEQRTLFDRVNRIEINPEIGNLMRVVLNVKNNADNGKTFSGDLAILRTLSSGNENLLWIIAKLDQYNSSDKLITNDKIVLDFNADMNKFIGENNLLRKNNSKFSKFLANFVVVRKTAEFNENSNVSDEFANSLISYMTVLDYENTLTYIDNSNYSSYFLKTKMNLENRLGLEKTLNELIEYITQI